METVTPPLVGGGKVVRRIDGELPGSGARDTWIGRVIPGLRMALLADKTRWNGAAARTIRLVLAVCVSEPLVPTAEIVVVATAADLLADRENETPWFKEPGIRVVGPLAVAVTPAGKPCSVIVMGPLKFGNRVRNTVRNWLTPCCCTVTWLNSTWRLKSPGVGVGGGGGPMAALPPPPHPALKSTMTARDKLNRNTALHTRIDKNDE
jgi:hypothetical protein